mmetsp:Transcript_55818/g.116771  ORF Transcript_55818/g.116771 Transcript_55818/m.116771 type:complete len:254 (+) Transcript_55818:744-1505(+)
MERLFEAKGGPEGAYALEPQNRLMGTVRSYTLPSDGAVYLNFRSLSGAVTLSPHSSLGAPVTGSNAPHSPGCIPPSSCITPPFATCIVWCRPRLRPSSSSSGSDRTSSRSWLSAESPSCPCRMLKGSDSTSLIEYRDIIPSKLSSLSSLLPNDGHESDPDSDPGHLSPPSPPATTESSPSSPPAGRYSDGSCPSRVAAATAFALPYLAMHPLSSVYTHLGWAAHARRDRPKVRHHGRVPPSSGPLAKHPQRRS